jgi:hypothetical protein
MRAEGVPPDLIGAYLGHTDSRMVERVYGRVDVNALGALLRSKMGAPDCCEYVVNPVRSQASEAPEGRPVVPFSAGFMVSGDRIELSTRGFSMGPLKLNQRDLGLILHAA